MSNLYVSLSAGGNPQIANLSSVLQAKVAMASARSVFYSIQEPAYYVKPLRQCMTVLLQGVEGLAL